MEKERERSSIRSSLSYSVVMEGKGREWEGGEDSFGVVSKELE